MEEITIRRAKKEDAPEMAVLDSLCFSVAWSEEAFRDELEGNEVARYLVAEKEGAVIGYAGLWVIAGVEGHITNVAVSPEYRRIGLASRILTELFRQTGEEGLVAYTLEARISNEPAILLYRKFGFTEVGIRKKYYTDNKEDALIMWRNE